MMKIRTKLRLLLLASALLTRSAAVSAGELTDEDIISILETNRPATIARFLSELPDDFLSQYSVFFRSRSADRLLVTPRDPRIVLVGSEVSIAFPLARDSRGRQRLEIAGAPSKRSGRFRPSKALFDPQATTAETRVIVTRDPPECFSRCHNGGVERGYYSPEDWRPNWRPYPDWPETFGSRHGIRLNSLEARAWLDFLAAHEGDETLAALPGVRDELFETMSHNALDPLHSKNVANGIRLARQNFDRITGLLLRRPDLNNYLPAILAAGLGRNDVAKFLPSTAAPRPAASWSAQKLDEASAALLASHDSETLNAAKAAFGEQDVRIVHGSLEGRIAMERPLAAMRQVFETMGVDVSSWGMKEDGAFLFDTGAEYSKIDSSTENLVGGAGQHLLGSLLKGVVDRDPQLAAKIPIRDNPYSPGLHHVYLSPRQATRALGTLRGDGMCQIAWDGVKGLVGRLLNRAP